LQKGRERLDEALETVAALCEPVQPPKGDLEHIHYFCGNTEIPEDLKTHEPQRAGLYKATAALVRAYANIADDLAQAGYSPARIHGIKEAVDRRVKLREIIRQASGETIDLKAYEADMRHLIDTYIEAKEPRPISQFGEIGLLELIVKTGIADAIDGLPAGIKGDRRAVAETIANNVRSKIVKEHLNDPAFYERMSALLREILADLKAKRIAYEEFLKRMAELVTQVQAGAADDTPEPLKKSPALRAIFNQLEKDLAQSLGAFVGDDEGAHLRQFRQGVLDQTLRIDQAVRHASQDNWRGNRAKENIIKAALLPLLENEPFAVERLFPVILAQKEY
jgi:type I restriction enzyme R subunit